MEAAKGGGAGDKNNAPLRGWWQQKNNQETFDKWLTSFTWSYCFYDNVLLTMWGWQLKERKETCCILLPFNLLTSSWEYVVQ